MSFIVGERGGDFLGLAVEVRAYIEQGRVVALGEPDGFLSRADELRRETHLVGMLVVDLLLLEGLQVIEEAKHCRGKLRIVEDVLVAVSQRLGQTAPRADLDSLAGLEALHRSHGDAGSFGQGLLR